MQALKQPELGKIIVELRQQKKWTQEELVEKCNLNVRTLQRIEAGEVTPREFTIKSIFDSLEYDVDFIEKSLESRSTLKWMKFAWVAGIIYFVSGFGEVWVDFERFDFHSTYFPLIYTAVKSLVMGSYLIFIFGFVKIGEWFMSDLLRITGYLLMATFGIIIFFDIISLFSSFNEEEFMGIKIVESVCVGAVEVLFGIAIYRLGDKLGMSVKVAGILEAVTGFCFATVILIPVGLFLMVPSTILDIVVLFKIQERIKSGA